MAAVLFGRWGDRFRFMILLMVQGSRRAPACQLPGTRGGGGQMGMWDVVRIIAVLVIVEGLVCVGRASGWLHDY